MLRDPGGPTGERPPYTWDWVNRLKDLSDMNLVVKGIVTAEEAELAIEHGADGIYVSIHGGRAVNSLWSTIDALPEVVAAVRGRVPVMIDSGVRRGGDVCKASRAVPTRSASVGPTCGASERSARTGSTR